MNRKPRVVFLHGCVARDLFQQSKNRKIKLRNEICCGTYASLAVLGSLAVRDLDPMCNCAPSGKAHRFISQASRDPKHIFMTARPSPQERLKKLPPSLGPSQSRSCVRPCSDFWPMTHTCLDRAHVITLTQDAAAGITSLETQSRISSVPYICAPSG